MGDKVQGPYVNLLLALLFLIRFPSLHFPFSFILIFNILKPSSLCIRLKTKLLKVKRDLRFKSLRTTKSRKNIYLCFAFKGPLIRCEKHFFLRYLILTFNRCENSIHFVKTTFLMKTPTSCIFLI